jgi:hypothetical protein
MVSRGHPFLVSMGTFTLAEFLSSGEVLYLVSLSISEVFNP